MTPSALPVSPGRNPTDQELNEVLAGAGGGSDKLDKPKLLEAAATMEDLLKSTDHKAQLLEAFAIFVTASPARARLAPRPRHGSQRAGCREWMV